MKLYGMTKEGKVIEISLSDVEKFGTTMGCNSLEEAEEAFKKFYEWGKDKNILDELMKIPFDD